MSHFQREYFTDYFQAEYFGEGVTVLSPELTPDSGKHHALRNLVEQLRQNADDEEALMLILGNSI